VADWFVEASKAEENLDMLAYVLDVSLKLAHPFAPFVTETIWQSLTWHKELLIGEAWPTVIEYNELMAAEFTRLQKLVIEARYVMAELPGTGKYGLLYQQDSLVEDNAELIRQLTRVKSVEHVDQPRGLRLANSGREAWLDVSEEVLYEHQTNLEVRLAETRQFVKTLEGRLANESYIAKAPAHLVEETREDLARKQALIERLQTELTVLS
jgi:valyl-tRNA synthetase